MAKKKTTFDAVAESRRWRVRSSKRLAAMTPERRREHLRLRTEAFFARKSSDHAPAQAHH
jgi:hypothetical protein